MSHLMSKQAEQIDAYEGEIIDLVEGLSGVEINMDNPEHYDVVKDIMDFVAEAMEEAGLITVMEVYPYVVPEKEEVSE